MRPVAVCAIPFAVLLTARSSVFAQDPAAYFNENCAACHTLGGGGDFDLAGVPARRDHAWLTHFIRDPEGVIKSGDPYASELVKKADGTIMPTPDGMTPALAEALVAYIEQQGKGTGAAPPPAADTRPFSAAEVALGRDLFTGARRLANAGPVCVSCHDLATLGSRGGSLGPDLTGVHGRLRGRNGLAAWLTRPPTPVMRSIYRQAAFADTENRALVALFEDASARLPRVVPVAGVDLLLAGVMGTLLALAAIGIAWSRRFRAVRSPLVREANTAEPATGRHALGTWGDRR